MRAVYEKRKMSQGASGGLSTLFEENWTSKCRHFADDATQRWPLNALPNGGNVNTIG